LAEMKKNKDCDDKITPEKMWVCCTIMGLVSIGDLFLNCRDTPKDEDLMQSEKQVFECIFVLYYFLPQNRKENL
jgi:hypothetical protein